MSNRKNTLWMILEAEESSAQPPTPPPVLGKGCLGFGEGCKDCKCQVVFIQCKGKFIIFEPHLRSKFSLPVSYD